MYSQASLPLIEPVTGFADVEAERLDTAVVNAKTKIRAGLRSRDAGRFCTLGNSIPFALLEMKMV